MTESVVEGSDWLSWVASIAPTQGSATALLAPEPEREPYRESWENTDRAFAVSARKSLPTRANAGLVVDDVTSNSARARWLQTHDVRTEFLDAGIGCCWFAQQGEDEPVCGETEEAAIARLAAQNGLPWDEL